MEAERVIYKGPAVMQEFQRPEKRVGSSMSSQEMLCFRRRNAPARAYWATSGDMFCCHTGQSYRHLVGRIQGSGKHRLAMKPGAMQLQRALGLGLRRPVVGEKCAYILTFKGVSSLFSHYAQASLLGGWRDVLG